MRIEIDVSGKKFYFAPDEAKEIYKELRELFGDDGLGQPARLKPAGPLPTVWTTTSGTTLPQNPMTTN